MHHLILTDDSRTWSAIPGMPIQKKSELHMQSRTCSFQLRTLSSLPGCHAINQGAQMIAARQQHCDQAGSHRNFAVTYFVEYALQHMGESNDMLEAE